MFVEDELGSKREIRGEGDLYISRRMIECGLEETLRDSDPVRSGGGFSLEAHDSVSQEAGDSGPLSRLARSRTTVAVAIIQDEYASSLFEIKARESMISQGTAGH